MKILRSIVRFIILPFLKINDHIKFKKRMKELRKRDPFIYK